MNRVDIQKEFSENFLNYAVAVNTDRAIPDATSGLKPVARRILYSGFSEGYLSSKAHVKSARLVSSTMGSFHPHGDSSIYGALVRLAQPWVMRYPLIDFHGNYGNQIGDGPAASRYTEVRLAGLAEQGLLSGLKKKNVDFTLNYDESCEEPVTLPSYFPNLLCNPNTGIGVALSASWAPHNLREVAKALQMYAEGKEPYIPAPDFPTGGLIINGNEAAQIVANGRGTIKLRGRHQIEGNSLVFYEIPYGVTVEQVVKEIGECEEEVIGMKAVRDESNKKGLRIVVECERDVNIETIATQLYAKTSLQSSFSYNQVALIDKVPVEMTLKDCCDIYFKHNTNCIKREATFDLNKAKARLNIVEGLLIALEDIDNVIAVIKGSKSANNAVENLMKHYNLNEAQAKAIVDMKLGRIAHLEKIELENEKKTLVKSIGELEILVNDKAAQIAEVMSRLTAIVNKYGDERRTQITHIEQPKTKKEKEVAEVVPEAVVVSFSAAGAIKRTPRAEFKIQKRNGKGIKNEESALLDIISTNTTDTLMIFTTKGLVYRLLVNKIPTKATAIAQLINMDSDDTLSCITSIKAANEFKYVYTFTKYGMIKKSDVKEYINARSEKRGIIGVKLKEGDRVIKTVLGNDGDALVLAASGKAIRFSTKEIAITGRNSLGVIATKEEADVIGALILDDPKEEIAIISKDGHGFVINQKLITPQGRGGKGVIMGCKDAPPVGLLAVNPDSIIMAIGKKNNICFKASELTRLESRVGVGVSIIKDEVLLKVLIV